MSNAPLISDELRDLIVRYMEACKSDDRVAQESILQAIREQGIQDHENYNRTR